MAGIEAIPAIIGAYFQAQKDREMLSLEKELQEARVKALKTQTEIAEWTKKKDFLESIKQAFGADEASKLFAQDPELGQIYRDVYGVAPTVVRKIQETITKTVPMQRREEGGLSRYLSPTEQAVTEVVTREEEVPRPLAPTPQDIAAQQKFIDTQQKLLQTEATRLNNIIQSMAKTGVVNAQQIWSMANRYNTLVQQARARAKEMGLSDEEAMAYFPSITQPEIESMIRELRQPGTVKPEDVQVALKTDAILGFLTGKSTPEQRMLIFNGKDPYQAESDLYVIGGRQYQIKDIGDAKKYYLVDPVFRAWIESQPPEVRRMLLGDGKGEKSPGELAWNRAQEAVKVFQKAKTEAAALQAQIQHLEQIIQQPPQPGMLVSPAENQKRLMDLRRQLTAKQAEMIELIRQKEVVTIGDKHYWVDLEAIINQYSGRPFDNAQLWALLSPEGRWYLQSKGVLPPGTRYTRGR